MNQSYHKLNIFSKYLMKINILKDKGKKIIPCGREPCHCINDLNLTIPKEHEYYKQCYQSWYYFIHH